MRSMRQSISELTSVRPSAGGGVELLGIEPLEEHARRLAVLLPVASRGRVSGSAHLERLDTHMRELRYVYVALSDDARRCERPSTTAEWLLGKIHTHSAAARDIHHE